MTHHDGHDHNDFLFVNIDRIRAVQLPDGWHKVGGVGLTPVRVGCHCEHGDFTTEKDGVVLLIWDEDADDEMEIYVSLQDVIAVKAYKADDPRGQRWVPDESEATE
ncbi:MAG TPA: hypothetical protein VH541_05440 [Gaiellaceae bacterium]|jgi:hypothetical protein